MNPGLNINKSLRVLVAPLNWGLGHAARCVPVIKALRSAGHAVILASDGAAARLLTVEFPDIPFFDLPSYGIRYTKNPSMLLPALVWQAPRVARQIKKEQRIVADLAKREKIDLIISDNRFGCAVKNVKSIFITHQLQLSTGNAFADGLARRINYRLIRKFDKVWVPDMAEENNLAGKLSHPEMMPRIPVKYIGALSRFEAAPSADFPDLLVLLSGPEPQRTIFESMLAEQLINVKGTVYAVRGLPGETDVNTAFPRNVKVFNHMSTRTLNDVMCNSKIIIARSGYSTIMDLSAIKKHAILVPTPGQGEQEYLAAHLSKKNLCITVHQDAINLGNLITAFEQQEFSDWPQSAGIDLTSLLK